MRTSAAASRIREFCCASCAGRFPAPARHACDCRHALPRLIPADGVPCRAAIVLARRLQRLTGLRRRCYLLLARRQTCPYSALPRESPCQLSGRCAAPPCGGRNFPARECSRATAVLAVVPAARRKIAARLHVLAERISRGSAR